jgi:glycosyltransferase involved in cell wall biosynthesis
MPSAHVGMRIMQVHSRYRSASPSGENRVVDQERAALVADGHEVRRFERDSDDIEGWPIAKRAVLPAMVVWNPESRRALSAGLREWRPDVVHVHNTFPLLSASILYACRDASVPVVATIHNYKLACAAGSLFRDGAVCHDCLGKLPGRAVLRGCYRDSRLATAPVALAISAHRKAWRSLVSAYVFISKSQLDLLSELRLPADRMFVHGNLVPQRTLRPADPERMVVYAGRLDEAKGIRLLMGSWDRYLESSSSGDARSRLRLAIAGTGTLTRELAAWAATRPSVDLAGHLDGSACAALMARARAVLVPSAWEETFGLVVVEAMALGVPPVVAGHGSLPELVRSGEDGVVFRPGDVDALAAVLHDVETNPARYQVLGDQARKSYLERFDPQANLRDLLGIYRYAIHNPA